MITKTQKTEPLKSSVKCFDCRKTALVAMGEEYFECTNCGIYGFRFTKKGVDRLKIKDRQVSK